MGSKRAMIRDYDIANLRPVTYQSHRNVVLMSVGGSKGAEMLVPSVDLSKPTMDADSLTIVRSVGLPACKYVRNMAERAEVDIDKALGYWKATSKAAHCTDKTIALDDDGYQVDGVVRTKSDLIVDAALRQPPGGIAFSVSDPESGIKTPATFKVVDNTLTVDRGQGACTFERSTANDPTFAKAATPAPQPAPPPAAVLQPQASAAPAPLTGYVPPAANAVTNAPAPAEAAAQPAAPVANPVLSRWTMLSMPTCATTNAGKPIEITDAAIAIDGDASQVTYDLANASAGEVGVTFDTGDKATMTVNGGSVTYKAGKKTVCTMIRLP